MDIPDEAWQRHGEVCKSLGLTYGQMISAAEAAQAAAPHIARAAQVQILREMADEIDGKRAIDAADLHAKADELERS